MNTKLTSLLTLLFIINNLSAQKFNPGYIVSNGDTTRGFISFDANFQTPEEFLFKNDLGANSTQNINKSNSELVSVNGRTFVNKGYRIPKPIDQTTVFNETPKLTYLDKTGFVELLISGSKSLFQFVDDDGNTNFLIQTEQGLIYLIHQNYRLRTENGIIDKSIDLYKGQLSGMLSDCSKIKSTLSKLRYSSKSLMSLLESYYKKCTEEYSDVFKTNYKKKIVDFKLLAGTTVNQLKFLETTDKHIEATNFKKTMSLSYGLSAAIPLDRKQNYLVDISALFTSIKAEGDAKIYYSNNSYSRETNTEVEVNHIKLQLVPHYSFTKEKLTFFFGAGFSWGFGKEVENKITQVFDSDLTTATTYRKAYYYFNEIEAGVLGSAGLKYKDLSFNLRYEIGDGLSSEENVRTQTRRLYLLLGYTF